MVFLRFIEFIEFIDAFIDAFIDNTRQIDAMRQNDGFR